MDTEKTLRILKGAYEMEVEGAFYYDLLAKNSKDVESKESFFHLMEEEVRHQEFLMEQIQTLTETGRLDLSKIAMTECQEGESLFQHTFKNANQSSESIVSALHIAIMLEKNSFDYYTNAAKESTEIGEKSIYQNLAKWEEFHLDDLNSAYEMKRQEIFTEERFSPF